MKKKTVKLFASLCAFVLLLTSSGIPPAMAEAAVSTPQESENEVITIQGLP